jgi:hypothetical protein
VSRTWIGRSAYSEIVARRLIFWILGTLVAIAIVAESAFPVLNAWRGIASRSGYHFRSESEKCWRLRSFGLDSFTHA